MPNACRISCCEPTVTAAIYFKPYAALLPNSGKAIEPEEKAGNIKWLVANEFGQGWLLQSSLDLRGDYLKVIRWCPDTFGQEWKKFCEYLADMQRADAVQLSADVMPTFQS
jgi:hypothetical protein